METTSAAIVTIGTISCSPQGISFLWSSSFTKRRLRSQQRGVTSGIHTIINGRSTKVWLDKKYSRDYKNKYKKLNCWTRIGEKFAVTLQEAISKCKNIKLDMDDTQWGKTVPSGLWKDAVPVPKDLQIWSGVQFLKNTERQHAVWKAIWLTQKQEKFCQWPGGIRSNCCDLDSGDGFSELFLNLLITVKIQATQYKLQ